MLKRVTSLRGPISRHYARATQLLSKKCRIGGEPLATLCSILPARDLNLRPHAPETTRYRSTNWPICSYRPFAVNSSVHLVKKFEWQLIFCLNTLIFISQTHMQKFSIYFPAVFF